MEIQAVIASRRELIYESNFCIFIPTSKHNERNFSGAFQEQKIRGEHGIMVNSWIEKKPEKKMFIQIAWMTARITMNEAKEWQFR